MNHQSDMSSILTDASRPSFICIMRGLPNSSSGFPEGGGEGGAAVGGVGGTDSGACVGVFGGGGDFAGVSSLLIVMLLARGIAPLLVA